MEYLALMVPVIGMIIFGKLSGDDPKSVYLGVTYLLFGLMALQRHTIILLGINPY